MISLLVQVGILHIVVVVVLTVNDIYDVTDFSKPKIKNKQEKNKGKQISRQLVHLYIFLSTIYVNYNISLNLKQIIIMWWVCF